SSSLLPPCGSSDCRLSVQPPSPAVRKKHCFTQSLPGPANLCLHICTCSPCSQIQPQPPNSFLKLSGLTVFTALHYYG
ncbi:hypothetical protein CHARACLAT_033249, partial [Characodon lateralis]|nr:hypothetical protein [Characodon lateralis]